MSGTLVSDAYSDEDMQCPATWYGGYKEPRLLFAGDAQRAVSDLINGDPVPSTFRFTLTDLPDGRLREQLASPIDRYWRDPIAFYMTSRANRALLGTPFTAFVGFLTDAQPTSYMGWDITLTDIITHAILNGELEVPWRKIGEGFLRLLDAISESLDKQQAEPIIYGRHTRTDPDVEPDPPSAWPVIPIYLGIQTVDGGQKHVWMVCGHACKSITIQVDGVDTPEGSDWLIATQANFISALGAGYVDYISIYGNLRRYSLIYGDFGAADPEACMSGEKALTALVEGVETVGDGSGTLITDYYEQYKHFCINYVANRAHFSYLSGAWLTSPTWDVSGSTISIVDEDSFDAASAVWIARAGTPLIGAAAIGFNGRSEQTTQIIAEWNRCGFVSFGQTHLFQMGIIALHPTQEAKDAAPLFTDAYEVLKGTFTTTVGWANQKTVVDFECDLNPETGQWTTTGISADVVESERYNRAPRLKRTFAFVPGLTQCQYLSDLLRTLLTHPLRFVKLEETVGPDTATEVDPNRLAYLNPGNHIKYLHFDAVGGRSERLAWIVAPIIRGSARMVGVEALDVEELIDFDLLGSPIPEGSPSEGSPSGSPIDEEAPGGDETFDYVVATDGSDGNTGTSLGSPFATLTHALEVASAALSGSGKRIVLREGTYDEAILNPSVGGTSWTNKIRVANYIGETVWLSPVGTSFAIHLNGSQQFIEFDGINIDGTQTINTTVYFEAAGVNHVRIKNAEVHGLEGTAGGAGAILINGTFHEFQNLSVHGTGGPYGFYIVGNDNLIEECDIYGVSSLGVHIYKSGGNPSRNVVRNNTIHNIHESWFFGVADTRIGGILLAGDDNEVYNNLIYDIGLGSHAATYGGVYVYTGDGNIVVHNSIYDVESSGVTIGSGVTNTVVKNNIVRAITGTDVINGGSGSAISNNIASSTDPKFVNPSSGDFRLQATSPALTSGTPIATVTTDFRGNARSGSTPSAGAYEGVG